MFQTKCLLILTSETISYALRNMAVMHEGTTYTKIYNSFPDRTAVITESVQTTDHVQWLNVTWLILENEDVFLGRTLFDFANLFVYVHACVRACEVVC